VRVGVTGHEVVDRLESALTRLGLPVTAAGVSARDILDKMQYDKKIKAGEGYFVLTPQIGSVSVAARVPDEAIAASLADILR
jgi:3-dehydroquinate synthetase